MTTDSILLDDTPESIPVTPTGGPIEVDLLIVGAGPVGLFATYYAGVRGLRTAVVDSLPEPGGQVSAMYPEKPIYDIAGFTSVTGRQLVTNLVEQAAQYDPTYLLGDQVVTCEPLEGGSGFEVVTDSGAVIRTGAVVIAGGIGTFTPRALPAGEAHLGRGLDYFVPRLTDYEGQDVVVVGGGDSACDWALALAPIAASVTLVHRRTAFRAHKATVEKVLAGNVEVITDAQVTAVIGEERVESVILSTPDGPVTRRADRVIAALGFQANLGPLRDWGLDLVDNRHIVVDSTMATSLPGVYAAGDITDYPGKVRLIAVGFGEAATAVNNAAVFVRPGSEVFPGHSTDQDPASAKVSVA
ncbi:NAD(P)/FAD-dependent oxidoreductase [Raineyella sp. W15-4]|uniref:NAD(P)/FAD-dependent oxidoreductase n=1 Tax=Raineyella sp. W15-4 TaxID=3081651 RepID=UPI002955D27E|nr:NAD(P)/FAD-dependent oxidoreductase [Raineyella sp. W15-4]WOQ17257.1 NAD(P)/FAD-dependent oxidoreductase [Raineyella sp. W15-4]